MSQHNIIGSEAFDRKPFILLRSYRLGSHRRRRAGTTLAYVIVATVALVLGAVLVVLFMAPQLADAEVRGAVPQPVTPVLSAPAVPGTSTPETPAVSPVTDPA